jgi:predicted dienelactone hydrolase
MEKIHKSLAGAALVLAVIGLGLYWFLAIPAAPAPNGEVSQARFSPGPYRVVNETFTAVDTSRPTRAYNSFPGLPERTLEGELWRPADTDAPGPLVVYSHGFMSFRQESLYMVRFLASHGYTVVAVDYPLSGYKAPDGPLMTDVVNQPGDISFVIDTLLARNSDPGDPLHATIDPQRIAVAGVSLGGMTSMLAAYHHGLRDPRVAAVISIAGPTSIFTPAFFADNDLPFLMIYAGDDAIVPYADNATPVLDMAPGATLVTLAGASHAGFAQPASTLMRFVGNPDSIGCSVVVANISIEVARQNEAFMRELGEGEDGIDMDREIEFCTGELVPEAMKAARQHMFTTLAAHAFLDSVFSDDSERAAEAERYLLEILPAENGEEVSVVTAPDPTAG